MPKGTKKAKVINPVYQLTLRVNDQDYSSVGETIEEAITEISPSKEGGIFYKTSGHFVVKKDTLIGEWTCPPFQVQRLFGKFPNKSLKVILAKNLERSMK